MKVLVVTTWFPSVEAPQTGTFVADDVQLLSASHEVVVLHLAPPGQVRDARTDRVDGVTIVRVPMSPSRPDQLLRVGPVIRRHLADADVLHTMALSSLLPFSPIRVRIPWVHTEHWSGLIAPETVPAAMRATLPLTERGLARPDVVVAVSDLLAARIAAIRRGPVVVIPNHVESPAEPAPPRSRTAAVRLIAVGGLVPHKGPLLAVSALAELRRRGVDASLTWLGDGPLRAEVSAAAERAGVAEHLRLAGAVAKAEVTSALQQSDVFLLPTESETFGVAIAEALVAGVPVVVGARGAQSAFVDEPDGALVTERTPTAYADAVQRIVELNSDRTPEQIGADARERFSPSTRADAYLTAYAQAGVPVPAAPRVDVVIPVHEVSRPIERAVASVLRNDVPLRVTVVAHDLDSDSVRTRLGALADDPRVRLTEHRDGLRRPAGPFNHGLDLATAAFVSVMGSDDELEPHAIDSWHRRAVRDGAEAVIPVLAHAGGRPVPTPPTRPLRVRRLALTKDRLSYRSAPLGLVSRSRFSDLRFDTTVATGEDIGYVTTVWSRATGVSFDRRGPAYLVHSDAETRTSTTTRPVTADLGFIDPLLASDDFRALSAAARASVVVKILRINVIGAVHNRRAAAWPGADRASLARVVGALRAAAPAAEHPLSLVDRRILDLAADEGSATASLLAQTSRRTNRLAPASLVARTLTGTLHREGPLRMAAASVLALVRVRGWRA
ncbi:MULTISPECIES: glycosyltransferase [unclassified Microbacterium]|uniref:glycosyltransferase n=1 Tax=unclassified Microbacterium TaxID=2609290 RepID=UPI0014439CC1|nr:MULTISPECIES: glycosyltransferase [unclassified Microbacterium]